MCKVMKNGSSALVTRSGMTLGVRIRDFSGPLLSFVWDQELTLNRGQSAIHQSARPPRFLLSTWGYKFLTVHREMVVHGPPKLTRSLAE